MIDNVDELNGTYNYEQALSVSLTTVKEYIDKIDNQTKKYETELDTEDIFMRFMTDIIKVSDESEIEDSSIYINPKLDDITKDCLKYFEEELSDIIDNNLGIQFTEPYLYLFKSVYDVFSYKSIDYFIYFINGLQKIDNSFADIAPNYNEYTFDYFIEKNGKKESVYQNIQDYIQYIMSLPLSFEFYISVALLEAEGDVALSTIYVEISNYRILTDDNFIFNKIKNVVLSPISNDYIVSKLISSTGKSMIGSQ